MSSVAYLPFCALGGRVVVCKHGGIEEELAAVTTALQRLGGRFVGVHPVAVTGLTDNRKLGNKGRKFMVSQR